jgi:hypothetical protein
LQAQLRSLLKASNDPILYMDVIRNLRSKNPRDFGLARIKGELIIELSYLLAHRHNAQIMEQVAKQEDLIKRLVRKLEHRSDLLDQLKDAQPFQRFLAIHAVAKKRLPVEKELIDLLADKSPQIRQAAKHALVRLSRGNDFGPADNAAGTEIQAAQRQWRQWLSLQDPRPETTRVPSTDD